MKALLKEPLLHFLLAGGLLFAVYAWIYQGVDNQPRVVRISAAEVNWLTETWTRQWSRQPDEQELRGLVAGHLKEKLLAREARELGLELDDTVVRRRLAQKMEFLVQDIASFEEPGEDELQAHYDKNRTSYLSPAQISFSQVYFKNKADAQQGLEKLKLQGVQDQYAEKLGDSSLLARDYVLADEQIVSSVFGPDFSNAVFSLDKAGWQGPVASTYGFHLVHITEQLVARQRPFEEVRKQVLEEWRYAQQGRLKEQYYAELLEKYDVVMDESIASLLEPLTGTIQ